jgi:periplasmic protein CpxP/Spy
MKDNKGMRILQWTVGLLVLCNFALILTIWLKPHHDGPPPHGGGPRDYVISTLKFTDDQVKKYDELINEHQQSMQQLRKSASEYRQALFTGVKNGNGPDSLAQLIGNNQKEIEIVTYKHFVQVRALCTDAQKTEFDNIIGDVTRSMNGGPGGGHPPHGDRQGPPPGEDGPPPPPQHDPPPPVAPQNH